MNIKLIFAIISLLGGLGYVAYLRDIFARKTTPHMYSWLIWSILQSVGSLAIFFGGGGFGALSIGLGSLLCISIFILSLFYGTKDIRPFDTICLVGALAAVALWIIQKDPLWSVVLISVIDFMGFLPTYRKSWREPWSETPSLYLLSAFSCIFTLLALSEYTLVTALYVSSLIITNLALVLLIHISRFRHHQV